MMKRPRLLDLGCCGGGGADGYARYFDVTGVDLRPQKHYPYPFILGDMLTIPLEGSNVIHASVPCQHDSPLGARHGRARYPVLLEPVRARLIASGIPWVIECVPQATFHHGVMLCGSMFGLGVRRHRWFECSHLLYPPGSCQHKRQGRVVQVCGHGGGDRTYHTLTEWHAAMGMSRKLPVYETAQAIPPAYTEWIARQMFAVVRQAA